MAFNYDETNPADGYLIPNYPGNARAFRAVVKAALAVEHDADDGRHKFGIGGTAARDAITTWVDGSIWFHTGLISGRTIMQVYDSGWVTVAASDETFADQTETDAGTETQLAVSPSTLAGYFASGNIDASDSAKGIIEIATGAEAAALTSAVLALTPDTLRDAFRFTASASGGHILIPLDSGTTDLCVQWGSGTFSASVATITFPTAFADTNYRAACIAYAGSGIFTYVNTAFTKSTTQIQFASTGNVDFDWIAIGTK